ncbi:peroxiredoxin family protein [Pedobacter sp. ASV28]|uniref:peroxiredoxin family protein n=1 Tax=Pedobacter sp. ASV28 TaxID=2795123 RepID=UPI00351C1037
MVKEAGKLYAVVPENLKNSSIGKGIPPFLAATKNTQVGAMALDFEQNTPEGKLVKLSSFRGKYVFIDFWASWCGPCGEENPNLVQAYDKYKNKGFEILGVSLDQPGQQTRWIEAIKDDKLTFGSKRMGE